MKYSAIYIDDMCGGYELTKKKNPHRNKYSDRSFCLQVFLSCNNPLNFCRMFFFLLRKFHVSFYITVVSCNRAKKELTRKKASNELEVQQLDIVSL